MKIKNIIDFVLLSALWGGSYVFMRFTVGHFEAIVVAQSRLLIGAICIGLVILFRRSLWQHLQLTRSDFGTLSIISIFNSTLPFALFTYALQYLNAGVGAILVAGRLVPMVLQSWLGIDVRGFSPAFVVVD